MDFGLGLVLSFTDNATSGIQNAVSSLNQLTETASNASSSLSEIAQLGAFSVVADQMGSSLLTAGKGVLSLFSTILGSVQSTGSEFESFRMTLKALYGDAETAETQVSKLLDFSIKSPFEVADVKDMLIVLKSQGIDAFAQMQNAAGDFQQENLAWIADLMAFKPDIPTERWKLAITNFLGSGEVKTLRNVLDMGDISQLLGHSIGDTAEERMNDLREIVETSGITGLADDLSQTWQGVASNIDDAFTKLYLSISDNGVFDKLKSSFMGVAGAIMALDNDEISALGKTIADGLNIIVEPITVVAGKVNSLITSIVDLCQTNPGLVKLGMVITAVVGALLIIGGIALKLASSLGMLTIGLTQFGGAFTSISGLLKSGALKITSALLPLTLTIGLVYLSWKNDFGGIRTLLTNFISNIRGSFDTARQALSMNVNDMMITVRNLQNTGDFWSNITVGLIKIGTLWQALCDAWGDYTLSEDLFLKCKELGILPLVEAILDLKWRFEHFVDGFKKGVDTVLTFVVNLAKGFAENLDGTIFDDLIDKATEFFQMLTNNDPQAWTDFGNVMGQIAASALIAFAAFKVFGTVFGIVSKVIGVVIKIGSTVASVVSKIIGIISKVVSAVKVVFNFLVNNPIVLVITGIITAVTSFVDMFVNGFNVVKEVIMVIGIALATVGAILMGVAALPAVIVGAITAAVATLIIVIKDHWTQICEFFSNLIDSIKEFFVGLWDKIKDIFSSIGEWFSTNIIQPVTNAFNTVKDAIVNAFMTVKNALQPIFDAIGNLLSSLKYLFETIWQAACIIVSNAMQAINDTISNIWNAIVGFITPIIEGIKTTISNAWSAIGGAVSYAMSAISGVISSVWNAIVGFISPIISSIKSVISSAWENISSKISSVMNTIKSTISSIWSGIVSGVSQFVSNIYTKVVEGFNKAVDWIKGLASKAVSWGADFIQGIIDGIASKINAVADAVKGVADKIKSFLHFSVPDEGPLTDYENWMPDFMTGLADGINSNSEVVTQAITSFTTQVKQSLNSDTLQAFQSFSKTWTQNMQVIITSTQQMSTGVTTGMTTLSTSTQKIGTGYSTVFKSIQTITTTTVTGVSSQFTKMTTVYTKSVTTMTQITQTGFTSMATMTQTSFTTMATTITTAMNKAVQAVQSSVNTMKSTMNFQWSLPNLKVPHVKVTGSFNLDPPTAPNFSVDWYAKGGVFDEPSLIGVGEAGKEAVMPLENNTEWIGELSYMIAKQLMSVEDNQFVPTDSSNVTNNATTSEDSYMTSNVTNNNNSTGDTDNSITFAEGAIQINCQSASEEEALKMAKTIMEYIKRQKELDKMLAYG